MHWEKLLRVFFLARTFNLLNKERRRVENMKDVAEAIYHIVVIIDLAVIAFTLLSLEKR